MSSVALSLPVAVRYPWLFGRGFDLFFFFGSFFLGLIFFQMLQPWISAGGVLMLALFGNAFGLGPFHQGPTWFAYLDSQNRAYWSRNRVRLLVFAAGPILILPLSVLAAFIAPAMLALVYWIWSIQHLVQQNVGILLLYHNHGANEAIVDKTLEARSQQAAAVFFSLLLFRRYIFAWAPQAAADMAIEIAAAVSAILVFAYLYKLSKQLAHGKYLNIPAALFWVISVACLWPMAVLGRSFMDAFLVPLVWHWLQYIGLNFRMVENKYKGSLLANLPLSRPVLLLVAACVLLTVVNLGAIVLSNAHFTHETNPAACFVGVVLGLGLCHYFLDAFLWRFREPYVRSSLLPYIKTSIL